MNMPRVHEHAWKYTLYIILCHCWCLSRIWVVWMCMRVSRFVCLVSGFVFGCLILYFNVWTCIAGVSGRLPKRNFCNPSYLPYVLKSVLLRVLASAYQSFGSMASTADMAILQGPHAKTVQKDVMCSPPFFARLI